LKAGGREGVVFKQIDKPYEAGRPASGGPALKFKFEESASFVVIKINEKRSVALILFEGDKVRQAGNVTIPANHEIPEVGKVVDVRYLYAMRESGSIYQPVFLGVRDDITSEECTVDQLKWKSEPARAA
ncbi:MAG: ligase, partial [Akkermansiaceae bacterium]|nr:ligase [Akkermansiaceae bacterium]